MFYSTGGGHASAGCAAGSIDGARSLRAAVPTAGVGMPSDHHFIKLFEGEHQPAEDVIVIT